MASIWMQRTGEFLQRQAVALTDTAQLGAQEVTLALEIGHVRCEINTVKFWESNIAEFDSYAGQVDAQSGPDLRLLPHVMVYRPMTAKLLI